MATKQGQSHSRSYNIYVVELSPEVLEKKKFREENPEFVEGQACYYVGMTGLTPEKRFENHKRGHKSSRYVHNFGIRLCPELYEKYNPLSRIEAEELEVRIAKKLRRMGHAVWQR